MNDLDLPFEEETPAPPEKRKRGAQPGNRNALKYGYYSHLLSPDEKKSFDRESLGKLDDEVVVMRTILSRTLKYFNQNPPTSFADQLHAFRAITLAITCLQGICKTQGVLFKEPSIAE